MREAMWAMVERIDPDWFRWAVGIVVGLLSSLSIYTFKMLDTRIERTDTRLEAVSKDFYERGARISTLEANYTAIDRRLERMEQKQDIALQKLSGR